MNAWTIGAAGAAGFFLWTLAEYALHCGAGHVWRRNPFGRQHALHHGDPRYYAPTLYKATAGIAVAAALIALGTPLVGLAPAIAFTLGFVVHYAGYEVLHRVSHAYPPRTAYGRWVRRNHLAHHCTDPNTNHGVTTPIWDLVFRTYRDPGVVLLHRRLVPDWMVDEEGQLLPEYAEHYAIRAKKPARRRTPVAVG